MSTTSTSILVFSSFISNQELKWTSGSHNHNARILVASLHSEETITFNFLSKSKSQTFLHLYTLVQKDGTTYSLNSKMNIF